MQNEVKRKIQVSPSQFHRLSQHPDALIVTAYYRYQDNFYEAKVTDQAFLLNDFIYAKVDCKKKRNEPKGTVRHASTYVRYDVADGVPRADSLAYVVIGKLYPF